MRTRASFAVAVLLIFALLLGYRYFSHHSGSPAPSRCQDLVAGCLVPGSGVRIYFDQVPRAMQAFHVVVDWPQAKSVQVSFSMQGMEMGLNRYRLLAQGSGRWGAEVILPACVQGRSDWVLQVQSGEESYAIAFGAR